MSGAQRRQPAPVIDRLLEEPYRFEFFQTLRLLERWHAHGSGTSRSEMLTHHVRFRNSLALSFPPSEIESLRALPAAKADAATGEEAATQGSAPADVEIIPAFFGLLGISGALPLFYTELFAEREMRRKDGAARAFLDVFQQRAVSLLYEAWRKHRLPLHFEDNRRRHYLPALLALTGMEEASRASRGRIPEEAIAFFSGSLQQRTHSAVQMQRLLSAHFGVPFKLEQFVGRWHTLPEAAHTLIGMAGGVLGQSALVGGRVWQRDLRMRLVVGPMDRDQFDTFLPRGSASEALRDMLTLMSGVTLEYEVQLLLRPEQAPQVTLGSGTARLGWDSWMHTRPPQHLLADARYDIHA